MNRVVVTSKVDSDGVLHLTLPLDKANAGREVLVTVETVAPEMSREEWLRFIRETAGSWQGEFERPPQGEYEERDPL